MTDTVLIVEDDRDVCVALKELLEEEGLLVDCVGTPGEAVGWLERYGIPCVMLLDWRLGAETAAGLLDRLVGPWGEVPVILTSAMPAARLEVPSRVNALLPKPFGIDALLRIVGIMKQKVDG